MKTLAIDFDDTLFTNNDWPNVGTVKPGAAEAVRALKAIGYRIVIHSCRTSRGEFPARQVERHAEAMSVALGEHGIPFDSIWMGEGKPIAWAYIDDKGIRYEENWPEIVERLTTPPLLPREFAPKAIPPDLMQPGPADPTGSVRATLIEDRRDGR